MGSDNTFLTADQQQHNGSPCFTTSSRLQPNGTAPVLLMVCVFTSQHQSPLPLLLLYYSTVLSLHFLTDWTIHSMLFSLGLSIAQQSSVLNSLSIEPSFLCGQLIVSDALKVPSGLEIKTIYALYDGLTHPQQTR